MFINKVDKNRIESCHDLENEFGTQLNITVSNSFNNYEKLHGKPLISPPNLEKSAMITPVNTVVSLAPNSFDNKLETKITENAFNDGLVEEKVDLTDLEIASILNTFVFILFLLFIILLNLISLFILPYMIKTPLKIDDWKNWVNFIIKSWSAFFSQVLLKLFNIWFN